MKTSKAGCKRKKAIGKEKDYLFIILTSAGEVKINSNHSFPAS